jgi:heme exporter protein A
MGKVTLTRVTKTFGPVRALVGVSLELRASEVTILEGPNGSGKSTLLALIGTLVRPTSGTISHGFLGQTKRDVRGTLGWLGHESLCYPDLTGRENLELAAQLYGIDPTTAFQEAESRFELAAFADRPLRTYSRGQRQRVALARALVHRPRLLLLDEPTTGLDMGSTERLLRVVSEEAERGALVVVVTHDPAFSQAVGHRKVTLERGRLVGT